MNTDVVSFDGANPGKGLADFLKHSGICIGSQNIYKTCYTIFYNIYKSA